MSSTPAVTPVEADTGLVDLLGETRAEVVQVLRKGPATVADLAGRMSISEVAIRRHVQVLERNGLLTVSTVRRDGPGRPSTAYALSDKARRLFPDNSAELANELLDFLSDEHGRSELLRFLRWRGERQGERYAAALEGAETVDERARALAGALSDEGFESTVGAMTTPDGATVLELKQDHCSIKAVAEQHPELCAFEASMFRKLLGGRLSRRQTIAGGATACVCQITDVSTPDRSDRDGHQG